MSMQQAPAEISAAMQTVADHIVHVRDKPLPDEVTEKTKHHLLDTLATMPNLGAASPLGVKLANRDTLAIGKRRRWANDT